MNQRKRKSALYRRIMKAMLERALSAPLRITLYAPGFKELGESLKKLSAAMSVMQIRAALAGTHKIISEEARNNLHASN